MAGQVGPKRGKKVNEVEGRRQQLFTSNTFFHAMRCNTLYRIKKSKRAEVERALSISAAKKKRKEKKEKEEEEQEGAAAHRGAEIDHHERYYQQYFDKENNAEKGACGNRRDGARRPRANVKPVIVRKK
mmetsp:Transcript_27340/g.70335  ORF Transcript_27340/g.70335 Transcript_27340/m.70335 type:complete len:129 (-) Transcript_27340:354-740(-)|eukprot:CAMPEP_0113902876 /NCGR_PEP_ID=MMETSP0780_2-20120614/22128_1 /TAXON_ID=652834 /ORGANISM="Palpitomonas bilix" /LENGTH=128 /DNA_ID=CAMNT_0000895799 /DNA_START=201 /DNA_END=587 /DNA_ORIENTATION=+ /assembly_acc=CAM_ASM_000599